MDSIVAMLHEHAAPVAELHGQGHAATWPQTVDIFASGFPGRDVGSASVAGKDLPFFKVDMDRVVPAAAGIGERPYLACAEFWRGGNAAKVRVESVSSVRGNSPGAGSCGNGVHAGLCGITAKFKGTFPGHWNVAEIGVGNQRIRNLAHIRTRRIAHNAKFQELAYAGVQ